MAGCSTSHYAAHGPRRVPDALSIRHTASGAGLIPCIATTVLRVGQHEAIIPEQSTACVQFLQIFESLKEVALTKKILSQDCL